MNHKRILVGFLLLTLLFAGFYYHHTQKQDRAYKTVQEINTNEIISNSMESNSIQLNKEEPFKTAKDLSKFEKEAERKNTVYFYNRETNTRVIMEYSNIHVSYEKQQNNTYTIIEKEFLNTTGEVQKFTTSTGLQEDTKITVENKIQNILENSLTSNIISLDSATGTSTTYMTENGKKITVDSEGRITQLDNEKIDITISYDGKEPEVPTVESEILAEPTPEERQAEQNPDRN